MMAASVAIRARLTPQAMPGGRRLVVEPDNRRRPAGARAIPLRSPEEARNLAAGEQISLRNQALLAFGIRVGSAGLAYLSQILFARLLGVEAFGVFSVAWTFVLVIGHVAPCGFAESAVRFLPRYQLRGQESAARGFIALGGDTVLIGGAAFAIAGGIVLLIIPAGQFCWPILGMLACIMPFAYQVWLEGVARGLDRPGLALACPYLLRPVLMGLVLIAAAIFGHATAGAAMLAALLATVATAALQEMLVSRAAHRALGDGETCSSPGIWLKASAPLAGGTACSQATFYADILALGLMRSPAEAAIYIAASRTLALASFAQYALSMVSGRRFAAAKADGGHPALAALASASTRLTILATFAAVAIVLLAGAPLLSLFGQPFSSAYPALIVLCIGALARALPGQKEVALTILGFQRGLFWIAFATLAVAIIANLTLVGPMGATGAACASALAAIFRSGLVIALARFALSRSSRSPRRTL
jgi:O-antigen/teichoic acid export membrane protein